jgi:nitrogen-specific signal transduction histidine kinase
LLADPEGLLGQDWIEQFEKDPWLKKMEVKVQMERALDQNQALSFLRAGQYSTFILGISKPEDWFEAMVLAHKISPTTATIVVAKQWTDETLRSFVNTARIHRPLSWQENWTELGLHLTEAMLEGEILQTQENLLNESRGQNRELQVLTDRLEEIVRDRTLSIEKSKDEIEGNLSSARNLIRFTQGVARQNSFEEIMTLLRREMKRFNKLGDPILLLQLQSDTVDVLSFRVGLLQESKIKKHVELPKKYSLFDKELSTTLANLLGRPIQRVIAFPLDVALIRKFGYPEASAVLCFESGMAEIELNQFLFEFEQVLKPVTIALDRLFLERELTLQSFRWEKTFDGLRDPIAVIDKDYRILRSNNKFSNRLVPQHCYQTFAGRDSICDGCPLEKGLSSGKNETSQIEVKGRTFRVHSYPIQLPGNTSPGSVVNQYSDVTPTKEIYARMLQSEKMSAIGMLAAHIAHELNNPLTGIQSLSALLVQEGKELNPPASEELLSDLHEIEKAAKRSQIIIKNLLDFTGEGDHQLVEISMEDLWKKTMPLLKTVLGHHSLQTKFQFSERRVQVDPHLLQQVVFNIANNASQAIGKKGSLFVKDLYFPEQKWVGLSVQDSGPGIPKTLQEKIFEPFFTTKEESQGTGLGLSLSREILRKYGGDLRLNTQQDNAAGLGAEFWILLPESLSK